MHELLSNYVSTLCYIANIVIIISILSSLSFVGHLCSCIDEIHLEIGKHLVVVTLTHIYIFLMLLKFVYIDLQGCMIGNYSASRSSLGNGSVVK